MKRAVVALLLLFSLAGCRTQVEAPTGDINRRWIYQRIANSLPRANFGWSEPPGIVHMSASAKKEGQAPPPAPLVANESGFTMIYQVYRVKNARVPYSAIRDVYYTWNTMPNALFCLLVVLPFQSVTTTVVLDMKEIPQLREGIERDIKRLESISREIGMGGPWAFAQNVKNRLAIDAAEHGEGMLAMHFDYIVPMVPWIPMGGQAEKTAVAFAWAKANPDAPALEPLAEPEKDDSVTNGEGKSP